MNFSGKIFYSVLTLVVFRLPRTFTANLGSAPPMDYCPPSDPNCHPWCIKYDSNKCRLCMCQHGEEKNSESESQSVEFILVPQTLSENSLSSSNSLLTSHTDWSSGTDSASTDSDWESWAGGKTDNEEKVKYIIIEKPSSSSSITTGYPSASALGTSGSAFPSSSAISAASSGFPAGSAFPAHGAFSAASPFQVVGGPSPFQNSNAAMVTGPGGSTISGTGPGHVPDHMPSVPPGHHIENVQISSQPGVPIYCVRYPIMCPIHCVKSDEFGCHSCPCAPASMQLLPVIVPNDKPKPNQKTEECVGTLLCMLTCKDGYQLGEVGSNGCQTCTCVKKTPPTTPPPKTDCAEKAVKCMLSCDSENKGYEVKGSDKNGCPMCHCTDRNNTESSKNTSSSGHTLSNNSNFGGTGTGTGGNTFKWPSGNNGSNTGGGGNNFLMSPQNGVGSGGCPGPMCPGTTTTGSGSGTMGNMSEMPKDCNPPMSYANCPGTTGSQSMGGSAGSSSGSSSCVGPFCASGSGSGGMNSESMGMTSGGGSTSSSGSCAGPFCAGGGGAGGSGGGALLSGGTAATGGMSGSPFMAAMSDSGGPGMGGMSMPGSGSGGMSMPGSGSGGMSMPGSGSGGMGMPGAGMGVSPFGAGGGIGPHGPMTPGSLPTNQEVAAVAGNTDCFGPSCSAKGGNPYRDMSNQECPELLNCPIQCDLVFDDSLSGCPSCTCLDH